MGIESRVQCGTSGAVSYTPETTNVWSLGIPLDALTNRAELEASQVCLLKLPTHACHAKLRRGIYSARWQHAACMSPSALARSLLPPEGCKPGVHRSTSRVHLTVRQSWAAHVG